MSNATYKQLGKNETRVLKLESAEDYDDEIIGSLIHICLDDPPEFEALSYVWKNSAPSWTEDHKWGTTELQSMLYHPETKETMSLACTFDELRDSPFEVLRRMFYQWGGAKPKGHIICDGKVVTIGAELNEALRRIRLKDQERMIWIDALCINQQDIQERNQHVQRMGEIYSKANEVLIWLGEYVSDAYTAIQVVCTLCHKIEAFMEETKYVDRGSIRSKFFNDPEIKNLRWDFLSDLINRAWFGRVWVLQEVVNAKKAKIYATNCILNWDAFAALIHWLRINDVDSPLYAKGEIDCIETILMISRLSDLKRKPIKQPLPRLLEVLKDSRACKSTMPIDKVYGVLGLVSEEEASNIEVDYSLDPAELFTRIAISELSKESGLEILYLCTKSAEGSQVHAPSWVPDWTQPCHHDSLATLKYKSEAAGSSKQVFRIQEKVLVARGMIFDTVQGVELLRKIPKGSKPPEFSQDRLGANLWECPNLQFDEYFDNAGAAGREWVKNAMSIAFPEKIITHEAHEDLWRAFCCNRTDDGKIPQQDWSEYFLAFVTCMTEQGEVANISSNNQMWETQLRSRRFMLSFGVWCYNRRFFRSEHGRFGWIPDLARPGDRLCVLSGLAVPLVLRPVESGGFEVVGDAYVQGLMDGEAMRMNLEEQDIYIA